MKYADIKKIDIANGPGVRVSLFVSGCTHHCEGCFNPETWDFKYGKQFGDDTIEQIVDLLKPTHIQGLSLLGGEPFDPRNQSTVWRLVKHVRNRLPDKDVWCYTGYCFEQLYAGHIGNHSKQLLSMIDVLVDGPFVLSMKNVGLRFRGSENQRIISVKETIAADKIVLWGGGDA